MNDKQRREAMLADCIERMQAGETAAECLTHYGADAAALAPFVSVAERLQRVGAHRLTADQRGRAKAALRAALVSQERRPTHPAKAAPWGFPPILPGLLRGLSLAGVLALALFAVVTITAVAASQPGDAAYPIRVRLERAPVLFKTTAPAKATLELRIADRRLADIEQYLAASGRLERNAAAALLSSDRAAAEQAAMMSEVEGAAVAERVATHARALAHMSETASEPQAREMLREAAGQASAIATRLRSGPREPAAPPGSPPTGSPPMIAPTETPAAPTETPAVPTVRPTQPTRRKPTSTPVTEGAGPGPRAPSPAPNATATPHAQPGPEATPLRAPTSGAHPTGTPAGPGEPGGNPTAEPGGPGEPGGNPTAEPGGPGEPGGNPTAEPGGPGEPGGNPTAEPGGPGEPGGNPTAEPGGPGEPGDAGGAGT